MEFALDIFAFLAKAIIILFVLGAFAALIAFLLSRARETGQLEVTDLSERLADMTRFLRSQTLSGNLLKSFLRAERKKEKQERKKPSVDSRIFVLDFEGDVRASTVDEFRDEISVVLEVANKATDEVVVRLESPGGVVHGYGLAASQLQRIKSAGIKLTVCVDKVAASGGYMMACVADQIIAAPFAILGSIGVVAQVPNFNKLLKKNDIEYEEITSGEYKRTVSFFGEITDKGRKKFTEQIEQTHDLFKKFVLENRPQLDLARVATGEYWYGREALELKLADRLLTSDEYIYRHEPKARAYQVKIKPKQNLQRRLTGLMEKIREIIFTNG